MLKGYVAQGDTSNAADCRVAYNKLSAQYGAAYIQIAGFSTTSDIPLSIRAGQSDFIASRNYNVLYWSSHGNSYPSLNVINGPMFGSYSTAYNSWRSTGYSLNVPILAACYQFDGDTNRSNWANNIMRHSDIRAMCGYHDMAPSGTDATIAEKFFNYCSAGSTGNSVMYSWKNANATTTDGSNYIIMVYYDNYRCYYRLPGFSTVTYPDPIRSSTSIYRYTSANPNGAVVPNTVMIRTNTVPYSLNLASNTCKSINISKWNPMQVVRINSDTDAFFYGQREYSMDAVTPEQGRAYNFELLHELLGEDFLASALLNVYDDAMAEVPQDNSPEEEVVIGSTAQVFQHYNGIILEDNCIASCSDATGVISLTNQFQDYSVSNDVDHIDLIHSEYSVFIDFIKTQFLGDGNEENKITINSVIPKYIRVNDKYILHYDVKLGNGQSALIDAMRIAKYGIS